MKLTNSEDGGLQGALFKSILVFQTKALQVPVILHWHFCYKNSYFNFNVFTLKLKFFYSGSNTNWVLLGDLTSQGLGLGDKADYFSGVVNVLMAKQDNCIYKACPVEECKKKIIDLNNGVYRCEKCNREHNNFKYRMLLSVGFRFFTVYYLIEIIVFSAFNLFFKGSS